MRQIDVTASTRYTPYKQLCTAKLARLAGTRETSDTIRVHENSGSESLYIAVVEASCLSAKKATDQLLSLGSSIHLRSGM